MDKWYTAVLVFRSIIDSDPKAESLTELQFRLVQSDSADSAYSMVNEIGKSENHSYRNSAGEIVRWQYAGMFDLQENLDDHIRSGSEVYSQILNKNAAQYVVPRERLTVFWAERSKDKTAGEILGDPPETAP